GSASGIFCFQAEDGIRGGHVTGVQTCALPISAGPKPAEPAPAPPVSSGAPTGRVLVVDDNPEVRAMLEDVLTSLGYTTRSAADGATAVRAVLTEAPDVVLLDVYMPGLSGVGALPTIVALAPNAKVIMISGAANEDVLKR